ncbi:hypothetical protein [uncultured Corynebacterium sp.]|uniref:hypothetical protein n=1 Tax=uncultured Corynebacterium sp. TaxID=159447 RepID=UPI0025D49B24|nr:hypothetical protein [uncultured Corynebacterium sp.]
MKTVKSEKSTNTSIIIHQLTFLIEFDDEFYQIVFELPDHTGPGRRRYNEYLSIDYRDFPVRITDIDRNVVVYPKTKE